MEDASRIVQKFTLCRGDAGDLSAIHSAILIWASIKRRVELERNMEEKERGFIAEDEWASLHALMSRMSDLHELANRISMALRHGISAAHVEPPMPHVVNQEAYDITNHEDQIASQTKSRQFFAYSQSNWSIKPE
jgi:hypothetical protein